MSIRPKIKQVARLQAAQATRLKVEKSNKL
jgi:hypothetical protein